MNDDDEAFIELLGREVGYNLRHRGPIQHRTGTGCPCRPEQIPHDHLQGE